MREPGERLGGQIINLDGEDVFIPDDDLMLNDTLPEPGQQEQYHDAETDHHDQATASGIQTFTADDCLQRVLEMFPDISHEYVTSLYNEFDSNSDYETLPGAARLDNIIEQLVSASEYPKEERGKAVLKKRKREDSIDEGECC